MYFILACELFLYLLLLLDCKVFEGRQCQNHLYDHLHSALPDKPSEMPHFCSCSFWECMKGIMGRQEGEMEKEEEPIGHIFPPNVLTCLKLSEGKMALTKCRHLKERSLEGDLGNGLKMHL